ncbi:MAG: transcription antitermination factor NusB [Pseudomonadota bacterium]
MSADGLPAQPLPKPRRAHKLNTRTAARMASVQALYQMDMAGTDVGDVVKEYTTKSMPRTESGEAIAKSDNVFFTELVRGVVRRQRDLDPPIDKALAAGWRLVRVDSILRAILRSGTYELLERSDIPGRVVINEYINVARAFFDEDEPRVVNGVLDRLARELRPMEFAPKTAAATNANSGAPTVSQPLPAKHSETPTEPETTAVEPKAEPPADASGKADD